jgi:hypothetical protein
MLRNENRVEINRPPAEVFKFISDLCNEPRYVPNVLETEKISDGPVAVGAKYREVTRVMFGRKAVATYEVTQYDAPTTFAFRGTSGRSRFRGKWVIEATDDGSLARFTAEAQLAWPTRYLERFVRGSVAATFAVMGRNLKLVLTAPPQSKRRGASKAGATPGGGAGDGKAAAAAPVKRQGAGGAARKSPAKAQPAAKRPGSSRKPNAAGKPNPAQNNGDGAADTSTEGHDAAGG